MYYAGESNVPGAPGNLLAGRNVNPLQDPRFRIKGGESPYRQPVLYNERSPEEDVPFLLPGQPQMPQAGVPGSSNLTNAIPGAGGNIAGMMAQANPTFPVGSPQYGQPVPSVGNPSVPMSMNQAEMKGLSNINSINQNYPGGYDAFLRQKYGVEMTPGGYRNIQGNVPAGFDNKIVS